MPNLITLLKAIVKISNAEIHVVYWDHKKKTPYRPPEIEKIFYYKRSEYNYKKIRQLLQLIEPKAIYIAGWMDYSYVASVIPFRRKGIPIIPGFDDWWKGTFRQHIASFFSFILTKLIFSHAWVSGPRQYEYAKRLGFKDTSIIMNLLSCDTETFSEAFKSIEKKKIYYPKLFLYVGRFSPEKGTQLLAPAYKIYKEKYKGTWKLVCIGNGPLLNTLTESSNIEVHPFSDQSKLSEFMSETGALILPSLRDFSPLVVHEAACAGLPMVLSSNTGNIPIFMIHNHNGLIFDSGSPESLAYAMNSISQKSTSQLINMGQKSHELSNRVTPEISAATFLSTIEH